ncbi:DODA-type extradiol aromatic ring-opening family dioxygenase [Inmirania thermothiophila]|uniref:4,5-DOPA dioxygenase extradiol n=1 Tax=Inmirania thermothiophila TaxID=1750597 RepID=A0A3N1Y766_9GAMM|nr:class III extradiol ring-cleavage dioxygenase [Inmirania thermothiophila]ROR34590.1 4,5-DOPA dioxygenase extradiol [Inmirania thermothiophila]
MPTSRGPTAPEPPVWFLSHGAPTALYERDGVAGFWASLPGRLVAPPRALLCVSAHWCTAHPAIAGAGARPGVLHDFAGFAPALYEEDWAAGGDDACLEALAQALAAAGIPYERVPHRPYDHGVWVPLKAAWLEPPMPVLQLSVCPPRDGAFHLALGRALRPLRGAGWLLVASGGIVHNLAALRWDAPEAAPEPWAEAFVHAVEAALAAGDLEALAEPRALPGGRRAHPSVEHYLPLLVAAGAAGGPMAALYRGWRHGSLALHAYGTDAVR